MSDYNKWRGLNFLTSDTGDDEIYDLRYDLYELDANLAGTWISFVDSNFKDINSQADDKQIPLLLTRAKKLKSRINKNINKNDAMLVITILNI